MKKYYTTNSYKKKNLRRSIRLCKRELNFKEKRRLRRCKYIGKSKVEIRELKYLEDFTTVTAPLKFSFLKYPEETISFIHKLERLYENRKKV